MRVILVFLASIASFAAAAVVDDFARTDAGLTGSATVAIAAPAAGATSGTLVLSWSDRHGAWFECGYRAPRSLPATAAALRLAVWVPSAPSVIRLSVRAIDAGHQIFQWSSPIPAGPAGRRELVVPIDPGNPEGHWSGRNDGRVRPPLRLQGFGMVYANAQVPAGEVRLEPIIATPWPTVALETDRFPSLVTPGAAGRADLVVRNPFEEALAVRLSATVSGWGSATAGASADLTIAAGGEARLALPQGGWGAGMRWCDWRLEALGAQVRGRLGFVVAEPVARGAQQGFRFGICSHTEQAPAAEQAQEMAAAAAAGARVVRTGADWGRLERTPGVWDWSQEDRLVELAAANGIELQALLGFCPGHAAAPAARQAQAEAYKARRADAWKITLFSPPEDGPWRSYVRGMAERYRGRIRLYEVWNEPDLGFWRGSTGDYIRLLRSAADEIRRADPAALVMSGGFATVLEHSGRAQNPDLQARVLAEAADAFDVHALHQHGPFGEFSRALDRELPRLRTGSAAARPLYFNETALTSTHWGEREQAITLVKKAVWCLARGAIGWTWYDLRNDGSDPADAEHNYGLLARGFAPKPAYAAYIEAVRRLQDRRPDGALALPGGRAEIFAGSGDRVLAWWLEELAAASGPWLIAAASTVQEVDLMGVARELPAFGGQVLAQPGREPSYLVVPGPVQAVPLLRLGGADGQMGVPMAQAGRDLELQVLAANPLDRALDIDLAWRSPRSATAATVALAPRGTATVALVLAGPSAAAREHAVALDYRVAGTPWQGRLVATLPVVRIIPDAAPEGRVPDWTLDTRASLVDLCQADPAQAAQAWRGADDLSARIWIWHADAALRIRAMVRDDRHRQIGPAAEAWKGDGIQLALAASTPGAAAWELGAALTDDGQVLRSAWVAPTGVVDAAERFNAVITAESGGLRYELVLPDQAFGLDAATYAAGLRFNLIVNDHDGSMRKAFVRIAPGLGESKDIRQAPIIRR